MIPGAGGPRDRLKRTGQACLAAHSGLPTGSVGAPPRMPLTTPAAEVYQATAAVTIAPTASPDECRACWRTAGGDCGEGGAAAFASASYFVRTPGSIAAIPVNFDGYFDCDCACENPAACPYGRFADRYARCNEELRWQAERRHPGQTGSRTLRPTNCVELFS